MSVVCCKILENSIEIAADSISVRGTTQDKGQNSFSKLVKVNNIIVGSTGIASEVSLFHVFCMTRKPTTATENDILVFLTEFAEWKQKKTDKFELMNSYLIIFERRVFMVADFFINEILEYEAIGAGMQYALSALHLGHSVDEAVETACKLSVYCERPVIHFSVPRKG